MDIIIAILLLACCYTSSIVAAIRIKNGQAVIGGVTMVSAILFALEFYHRLAIAAS